MYTYDRQAAQDNTDERLDLDLNVLSEQSVDSLKDLQGVLDGLVALKRAVASMKGSKKVLSLKAKTKATVLHDKLWKLSGHLAQFSALSANVRNEMKLLKQLVDE